MSPAPRGEPRGIASVPVFVFGAVLLLLAIGAFVFGLRRFTRVQEDPEADAAADAAGPSSSAGEPTPGRAASSTVVRPVGGPSGRLQPSAPPREERGRVDVDFDAGSEVDLMLAQAALLAETDPAEARRVLQQLLERHPRSERVLSALASSLDGTDDERARDVARRCLEVNAGNIRCNTVMFSTYVRVGDYDAGLPYINECIRADSTDIRCMTALLDSRLHRGEIAEAQAVSERIRERDDGGVGVFAMAQVAEASGQSADALREYQSACAQGYDAGCARAAALSAAGGR
ncbi:MAG: hypothetical protein WCJ30_07355 [Deltaproteobacteria bacterium]